MANPCSTQFCSNSTQSLRKFIRFVVPQEALIYLGVVLGLVFALIIFGLYLYRLLCFAHTSGLRCLDTKPSPAVITSAGGRSTGAAFSGRAAAAGSSAASTRRIIIDGERQGGCSAESVQLLRLNDNKNARDDNDSSDSDVNNHRFEERQSTFRQHHQQAVHLLPSNLGQQHCQNVDESDSLLVAVDQMPNLQNMSSEKVEEFNNPVYNTPKTDAHEAPSTSSSSAPAWVELTLRHRCCQPSAGQGILEVGVLRAAGISTLLAGEELNDSQGEDNPVTVQVVAMLSKTDSDVSSASGKRLSTRSVGVGASAGGACVFGDLLGFESVQCVDLATLSLQLDLYACPFLDSRRFLLASSSLSPPALRTSTCCQTNQRREELLANTNVRAFRLTLVASAHHSALNNSTDASQSCDLYAVSNIPASDPTVEDEDEDENDEEEEEVEALTAAAAAPGTATESLSSLMGQAELFLGLTYNSLTGQLGVEVLKGSGLRPQKSTGKPPDTMVKLCLESASTGKAMFRCKTSCSTGTPHPMWKENFVFPVNKFQLVDVSVFVCVYAKKPIISRLEMIGWFALGFKSSGEEERAHWQDMLEIGGSQICRWHRLLPASSFTGPKL